MLHIEIAKVISGLGCNFTNGLGKSWEKAFRMDTVFPRISVLGITTPKLIKTKKI